MSIAFDKTAASGKQFTVTIGEQTYQAIPATAAEVILRRAGLTLRAAREQLAMARFGAASATVAV